MVVGPSPRFLSGLTKYTYLLANHLSSIRGLSTSVLFYRRLLPSFLFPGKRRVGKPLSSLRFTNDVQVLDGMDYLPGASWEAARGYMEAVAPDALIVMWWTVSTTLMTRLLLEWADKLGIQTIADIHELPDPTEQATPGVRMLAAPLSRNILSRFDRLIVHSKEAFPILDGIGVGGIPSTYLPIPTESRLVREEEYLQARARWGFGDERVVVLPGLIRDYKGHTLLFEAMPKVYKALGSNVRFVIAGETWDNGRHLPEDATQLLQTKGLTMINEYLTDRDYWTLLRACDMVVMPYLRTMQSGVASDAMSLGKPVVSSDIPGLQDQFQGYDGASFFKTGDSEDLTRTLIEALCALSPGTPSPFRTPSHLEWGAIASRYADLIAGNGHG